jgi:DNA polymerase-3 subunit chi
MGHAMFYHLTRSSSDAMVQTLVPKALAQGWHVVIRSPLAERLGQLDDLLWQQPEDGFLPHAIACGEASDAKQPVLLTTGQSMPNGARYLIAMDGAEISPAEVEALERACLLFEDGDATAMTHARALWKSLTDQGVTAQYWSEESGAWRMKLEKRAE